MKRMLWMLAALLMAGCEQSPIEERTMPDQPVAFWATFEGTDESDSRTYLDEQSRMRWTADDRLTVFTKTTYNREFAFTGKTGANAGGFRQVSVDDPFWFGYNVDYNYAIYPHAADNAFDETDCFFTATLPAEQTYVENSFGPGANTMVAVSESGQLLFKNVCSYLRIMLYGAEQSVKKITLSSIADEALAGEAKIYASLTDDPTCTMVGATSSIVLNCEEAINVNTTEEAPVSFWIVVPPVTLSKGYKVTVENAEGETQEFFVNKEKTFTRNVYSTLKRELTIGQTIDPSSAVPSNQIWYTSSDETMIEPAATGESVFGATITSHTYNNGLGVITFSGDVTKIGSNAFNAKTKLVTISLPETVTEIGSYAFQNCTRLTEISAPKVTTISSYAFYNCAKLAAVPFASNLTSVGSYAFQKCASLISLNLKNVTSLGSYAFYECSNLEQVTLLALKGSIGTYTFYNCAKLKEINIPSGVTNMGQYVFFGCSSLTSIHISDLTAWLRINIISSNALPSNWDLYMDGKKLTDITIPNSVTTIRKYAFNSCKSLISVTIPNGVLTIGERAFSGCSSLTTITISDSIAEIGNNAFSDCSSLLSVTMSESVSIIEPYTFAQCSSLISINIPEVTTIGERAFYGCSSLSSATIPESVIEIGPYAFCGCTSLESATIPGSLTKIDKRTFDGCSSLASVALGEGVTEIGESAFYECGALKAVTIPKSLTTIRGNAFASCNSIAAIYISDLAAWCNGISYENINSYLFSYDRQISLYLNEKLLTDLTIPANITTIPNRAFIGCSSLKSVTIPNHVTSLGSLAFCKCTSLTSINIGEGLTSIGNQPFMGCSSLTSVTFPKNLTSISYGFFQECSSLTSVTIPDSVTAIGNYAFYGCSSLVSIKIPQGVTTIGEYMFEGCTSLSSVTIPESVSAIGLRAFFGCTSLSSVTIPESVATIGGGAFYDCSSLVSIYCKPTVPPTLESLKGYGYVFDTKKGVSLGQVVSGRKFYVPASEDDSVINAYKAADFWKSYADSIVEYEL